MQITKEHIENFEQRFRTTFINSLAGFRQAVLVGTKSKEGWSNLAIFNSLIHLGANPALFGLINRPDSVQRDTLQNITETGSYSLNFVAADLYQKAHQTSARYDKEISEFEAIGLTERTVDDHHAPILGEAVVSILMQLEQITPIELNGTKLIIGSIQEVILPDELVHKDGFIGLDEAQVLVTQGLDAYFSTQAIGRLPYAKP